MMMLRMKSAARLAPWAARGSASGSRVVRSVVSSQLTGGPAVVSTIKRVVQHDRALCTTLGVVAGGVAVTAVMEKSKGNKEEEEGEGDGEKLELVVEPSLGDALLDRIVSWYRDYERDEFLWGWTGDIRRQVRFQ